MADVAGTAPDQAVGGNRMSIGELIRATELDLRQFGMVVVLGIIIGAYQGFLIAYVGIPSFVVTLSSLFLFRGLTWQLSGGTTVAPNLATFNLIGGGPQGSLGGILAWILGLILCVAAVAL